MPDAYPSQNTKIAAGHIPRHGYQAAKAHHAAFTMVILPSYEEAHDGFIEPGTLKLLAQNWEILLSRF